ncbi:hypothetical protein [Sorangium sp. So ce131]|uniref:hypothetical protein n=1 Tax=Sorangium sp. So ce131 TaxID=3133282 RepID=UPI003F637FE5
MRRCVDGLCEVERYEGRIDSRVRGDCMQFERTDTQGYGEELIVLEKQDDTCGGVEP